VLNNTGRPAEAVTKLEQALRLNPHPPFYYLYNLGEAYARTGRYADAIAAQQQVLLQNPEFLPAHLFLAEMYWAQWDALQTQDPQVLARALESAQKAVALNEALPDAHHILARVYFYQKQYEQAIAEIERTIALAPSAADSYVVLSYILSYAGQPERAITAIEQALRLNPQPPGWYYRHLGQAYRLTGRVEEAIAALQRALALTPDHGGAHYELAILYSEGGREEEARAEVAELRRLVPTISAEVLRPGIPYKDPAEVERMLAALRKAGLE
jgi:tetratricopeptide (TPR) repeat protein